MRWKVLAGIFMVAAFARAEGRSSTGFPTAARVEYVLECMREHEGGEYERLNKCSCVIDRLAENYAYDDFVEAQTMAKAVTIAGERGSVLRDNEQARSEARSFVEAVASAEKACFLRKPRP